MDIGGRSGNAYIPALIVPVSSRLLLVPAYDLGYRIEAEPVSKRTDSALRQNADRMTGNVHRRGYAQQYGRRNIVTKRYIRVEDSTHEAFGESITLDPPATAAMGLSDNADAGHVFAPPWRIYFRSVAVILRYHGV